MIRVQLPKDEIGMVWNDDLKPTPLKLWGGSGGGEPLPLGDCQKNLGLLNA